MDLRRVRVRFSGKNISAGAAGSAFMTSVCAGRVARSCIGARRGWGLDGVGGIGGVWDVCSVGYVCLWSGYTIKNRLYMV